jgi:membrane fusion protein (multidrug efflux system)
MSINDRVRQTISAETASKLKGFSKQYTFGAVAVSMVVAMLVLVAGKDVANALKGGSGGEQAAAGPSNSGAKKAGKPGGGGGAPLVTTAAASMADFSDAVHALGTAQARESITVTAKVSDTIRALHFESGQQVKKGQVLVELANVEQRAALEQARAQLEVDRRAYARYKELYDKGFSPKAKIDEAEAALARSQADLDAVTSRIADRTIRAPFDGVVGLRTASPGMLATPGVALATLDDTSVIKLDFDVPEASLSKMTKGAALAAKAAAYPNDTFRGAVDQIDTRINATTRTVRVRALLPNRDGRLKPGMLMTVDVLSNTSRALAVQENALIVEADSTSVYRVARADKGPPTVEKVRVEVGRRQNGMAEILSGVAAGDLIVTEGMLRVRPGQPVKLAPNEQGSAAVGKPETRKS